MFWVGLTVTVIGGLLGIPLVREWIQHNVGHNIDRTFDIIRVSIIILGAVIAALSYRRSQNEKKAIKENLSTVEFDFYRIKKFDVDVFIIDLKGTEFHSHPSSSEEMEILVPKNAHELIFQTNIHPLGVRVEYIYELLDESDKKIDFYGRPIDILSKYYLRLHPKISINYGTGVIEPESRILNFIKGIYFIIKVNNVPLYKFLIERDEFEIETIRDEPNYQENKFIKQIYLGRYFNNAEELRKIYREKLGSDTL